MDEESSSRFVFEVEDGVELRGREQVIRFIEGGGRGVVDCGFEEKEGVGACCIEDGGRGVVVCSTFPVERGGCITGFVGGRDAE